MRLHAAAGFAAALSLSLCDARTISLRIAFHHDAPTTKSATAEANCTGVGNAWTALTNQCLCKPCDRCKFSFTAGECRLITPMVESRSDGTDTAMQQPELAADKWFLTEDEMTASRGGIPRETLHLWTPHNNVTTFAGTNEFFDAVYEDLEATTGHDHAWITGWSFDDVVLRPQIEDAAKRDATKTVAVLQRLVERGTDLHVLGWTNFLEAPQNNDFQKKLNAMKPAPLQGDAYFLFDNRLPEASASHHQKTIAIKRKQGAVAYVGGIDLTWNRWDTIAHNQSEIRQHASIERDDSTYGWMDCHLRVDGPAASDVAQNFLQRWNMDREPFEDLLDPLLPFKNPAYSKLADLNTTDEPLVENKDGKHAVQVVRTYSCQYDYEAIAPRGELSMFHSRLKAIKMARNYVYIEDQYFLHVPQLMDALLQVLPRLQRVVVVTQPASWATQATGFDKYHWQMLQPLMDKYPRKVQVFAPKADRRIYVHSKLVIVDDVFVSVSSSNWNRRSMTTDTELGASVVDSETVVTPDGIRVTKLARDYRVRKFMELSGKSYREIDGLKLLDACDALGAAANDPRSMLARHKPKEDASFLVFTDTVQDVADPMALCAADP